MLSSLAGLALMRAIGRFPGWHLLPFLWLTLTFAFLTQHPFPAFDSLDCPVATAVPQLIPFRFFETIWRLDRRDAAPLEWLKNRALVATVMNFGLCLVIGLTLAVHLPVWRWAALFGITLTLSIELTQFTGIWGLYPCAYRQFNVDDLMMNALGVASGAAVSIWWKRQLH
jgi:glycopeptide antibiotics resistance protein